MRCVWLLTLLLLSGCYYPYGYPYSGYGYGGYGYGGGYQPGYYSGGTPQYHGYTYGYASPSGYSQPTVLDPSNCGTPDQPRPCYGGYR
jgi:hypothetical protein